MNDEVYTEILLDHYRSPRNYGSVENPSAQITEHNPLCGDTVHFSLKVEGGKIVDIKFVGQGCSISQGAASILTELVKGKSVAEVQAITDADFLKILGIRLGPNREKCALLSLNALKKAISTKNV
ncbi:MAG: SUF system NifU family Fe-S cluster assembly protein [Candidatus Thermoplasmatota archaeon]|nr:SUF system NifU family Fe-S cluster assembly protein [Candidatus Thermoplasmatota archaeon]